MPMATTLSIQGTPALAPAKEAMTPRVTIELVPAPAILSCSIWFRSLTMFFMRSSTIVIPPG